MQEQERHRRAQRALTAGAVAAVAFAALYAAGTMSAGWTLRLVATVVGLASGLAARWAGGALASRAARAVGVVTAACVLLADIAIGAIGVGQPFAFVDLQTLAWGLAAGLAAYLVADGFDALGVFVGNPGRRAEPPKEHLRGTLECPSCGSLQTEPSTIDPETGEPRGFVCNACDHGWSPDG